MRTIEVKASFTEYGSPEELPVDDRELLAAARTAMQHAYAPYSRFYVGAAVRLANGIVVTGNNQENAAYPSGLCAERVAVFAAAANHPGVAIAAIAIAAHANAFTVNKPVAPCGACRQVLAEYEHRDQAIRLILSGETGPVVMANCVEDLLPMMFHAGDLNSGQKK